MKIHAIICSKSADPTPTRGKLTHYLFSIGAKVRVMVDQPSIFEGYKKGVNLIKDLDDEDIIIFCHDDIEILNDKETFLNLLITYTSSPKSGFIGVAGASELGKEAIWWDKNSWQSKKLHGVVYHGECIENSIPTTFGRPFGHVVCLDGVFLACRAKVFSEIQLDKPEYFLGDWDFYDIYYTVSAFNAGLTNRVVPIMIRHESPGDITGRTSWHNNREAFKANFELPISIK